jgi:transposase-like protein
MSQHFLLTAAARSLSLRTVARMSEEEAHAAFVAIRWSDNAGQPYCPKCGCVALYQRKERPLWKCKGCTHEFSVTSGTIFASRKMAIRDILLAIAIFVNGAKGHSALQLSRDLDCQYKTAFVLAHKLREAMGAADKGKKVSGEVEIDGMFAGGYVKPPTTRKTVSTADWRCTSRQAPCCAGRSRARRPHVDVRSQERSGRRARST